MATDLDKLMQKMEALEGKVGALGNPSGGAPSQPLPSDPNPQPVGPDGKTVETQPQELPVFTWDQLQQAAQENKISESQAQQIWADQQRRLAVSEAKQEILGETEARDAAQKVEGEISKYREAIPQVMQNGTEQRARVVREFQKLTGMGMPKNALVTELAALQAAFGPVENVVKALKTKPEGHQDMGIDTADDDELDDDKADPKTTPPKNLSRDEKKFYEDLIQKRVYRDWEQVRSTLKHSNPLLRRKYGARV